MISGALWDVIESVLPARGGVGHPSNAPTRSSAARTRAQPAADHPRSTCQIYKKRNTVERGFNRLMQWRGIATRYDKLAVTSVGGVILAATVIHSDGLGDTPLAGRGGTRQGSSGRDWRVLVLPSHTREMKTAISVPNGTYERVVRMARELGVSRSELFSRAAERYLDEVDDARVTELVNEVLARDPAAQEPNLAAAEASRARLLEGDDW